MRYRAWPFSGGWTTVDLTASGVRNMKIRSSQSAPMQLTWEMGWNQVDVPIPNGSFVQVWDDAGNYEGTSFSSSFPNFEGFCQASPGRESTVTEYIAFDPTGKASQDISVIDEGWTDIDSIDTTGVPRSVYNCLNDRDTDWAISKANPFSGQTGIAGLTYDLTGTVKFLLSEIIADILNEQQPSLIEYGASPAGGGSPYVSADLDVSGLQWVPQDKIVIQNETVRSAVTRLLSNYAPAFKLQFRNGDRTWRVYNAASGTSRTFTLNDWDADQVVLNWWIHKSVESRATAVELYGPKNCGVTIFSTADGTLTTTGEDFQGYINGTIPNMLPYSWQITNPDDRPGSRVMPQTTFVPVPIMLFGTSTTAGGHFQWTTTLVPTRSPTLQASWDGGNSFITISNPYWNFREGTVTTGNGNYVYIYTDHPPAGSDQNYFPPDVVRLVYAPFTAPLSVRYPTSGYSGTAYSNDGITAVYRQYHEMLAVGYETNYYYQTAGSGTPTIGTYVTTDERLNQYKLLAQAIHSQRSNTAWSGGVVLDGLYWDMLYLNRRVNLAGLDGDGSSQLTNLESIYAIVTDVEFDFKEQTTTIMFNSDLLDVIGYPVELLMQQLQIRALQRRVSYSAQYQWQFVENKNSWRNAGYWHITGATLNQHVEYVDPRTPQKTNQLIGMPGMISMPWQGLIDPESLITDLNTMPMDLSKAYGNLDFNSNTYLNMMQGNS